MVKKEIDLRKENIALKVLVGALVILCVMFATLVLYYNFSQEPRIQFYEDAIYKINGTEYSFNTMGRYYPAINMMKVSLNRSNDNVLRTIFHEYGHHIYFKRLNYLEQKEWRNVHCDKEWEMEGYDEKDYCVEQFAIFFSSFMSYKIYNEEMLTSREKFLLKAYKKGVK